MIKYCNHCGKDTEFHSTISDGDWCLTCMKTFYGETARYCNHCNSDQVHNYSDNCKKCGNSSYETIGVTMSHGNDNTRYCDRCKEETHNDRWSNDKCGKCMNDY